MGKNFFAVFVIFIVFCQGIKMSADTIPIRTVVVVENETINRATSALNELLFLQNKENGSIYSKRLNLSFLNTDSVISINRNDSKALRKLNKKYAKIMKAVVEANGSEKIHKAETKALKFFEELRHSSLYLERNLANYQIGHYYAFRIFDPYYDGDVPSDIDRSNAYAKDKYLALKYLDNVPEQQGYLRMIPNTWMTDYEKGIGYSISAINWKKYADFLYENSISVNFFKCGQYSKEYCDLCSSYRRSPNLNVLYVVNLLNEFSKKSKTLDISKQLLKQMTSEELVALALNFQKQNKKYETIYYSSLAAYRGDINGLILLCDEWINQVSKHYSKNHPEYFIAGTHYYDVALNLFSIKWAFNNKKFDSFFQSTYEYYTELADYTYDEYEAEINQKKRARRAQLWANIAKCLIGSFAQTGSMIVSQRYGKQINSQGLGNLNSLLDPRIAAMQVNNQYYNEYIQFCQYNKKIDGSNYSFDEWWALKGQAILNLKNQGYDVIAESKKINEQQKLDRAAEREQDKKAWFAKYGYDSSSSSSSTSSSSNTTKESQKASSSKSESTNGSYYNQKQTYVSEEEQNLDSKQQYKSDPVSSDDYHKVKLVDLYIRDGNTNRIMFSNKELCKKGASYYVKIDNKYYVVQVQGGWGFNSSILYSHNKLYFNK